MNIIQTMPRRSYGMMLYMIAILAIALMDVFAKFISDKLPINQILLFRTAIALIPVLLFTYFSERKAPLKVFQTKNLVLQTLRGFFGGCAFIFFILALKHAELAVITLFYMLAPILIMFSGIVLLKEQVSLAVLVATAISFSSAVIISGFSTDTNSLGAILAGLSAISHCVATILGKMLSKHDKPATIAIYSNLTVLCIAITWCFISGLQSMNLSTVVYATMLGICGGVAYILFACSLQYTEVSRLSFLEYSGYAWAVLFGLMLFSEVPDTYQIIGSIVILSSGITIMLRQNK